MDRRSPLPHQSHPISACPLLSHGPCQLAGTIQFISSRLRRRICCHLQRVALKHLGSCSFTWCICQLLEAALSSPGCGNPSTLGVVGFAFWAVLPVPTWTAAVAHMRGMKACPLPGLLLVLQPGALEGQRVKELVIEINEGKPPSYCPQRLFLVELF